MSRTPSLRPPITPFSFPCRWHCRWRHSCVNGKLLVKARLRPHRVQMHDPFPSGGYDGVNQLVSYTPVFHEGTTPISPGGASPGPFWLREKVATNRNGPAPTGL